jgi:hypothetical protein
MEKNEEPKPETTKKKKNSRQRIEKEVKVSNSEPRKPRG